MQYFPVKSVWLAGLLLCSLWSVAQADLILTSPPRESKAAGIEQYGPLAEFLSQLLGKKVVYQHPKSWLHYQRDMRADQFDIVFDGPHFISWRQKRYGHTPVAKLPDRLGFLVVVQKQDQQMQQLSDLVNQKLCAIAPPNLSSITILARMNDPFRKPRLVTRKGGMKGVFQGFQQGLCRAAILRDQFFYKKLSDQDRSGLRILYKTRPASNQGISVSPRLSDSDIQLLKSSLTQPQPSLQPILQRFARKASRFLPASATDYAEDYRLLAGIISGWEVAR